VSVGKAEAASDSVGVNLKRRIGPAALVHVDPSCCSTSSPRTQSEYIRGTHPVREWANVRLLRRRGDRGSWARDEPVRRARRGGDVAITTGAAPARLLLLAARPIGEPVARYGLFVEQITQAIQDF
jgi:hypothetical protein